MLAVDGAVAHVAHVPVRAWSSSRAREHLPRSRHQTLQQTEFHGVSGSGLAVPAHARVFAIHQQCLCAR